MLLLVSKPNFVQSCSFIISICVLVHWAPACLMWSRLNKHLAPFLQWQLVGTVLGVQWRDNLLFNAVKARYKESETWAHQMLYDYYNVSRQLL